MTLPSATLHKRLALALLLVELFAAVFSFGGAARATSRTASVIDVVVTSTQLARLPKASPELHSRSADRCDADAVVAALGSTPGTIIPSGSTLLPLAYEPSRPQTSTPVSERARGPPISG